MRFASKLSILAFSGITVLAFANNPTLTGRNLNLQARDLNDLADDLYARGWADRGLHERDLLNNDYERSLDFNELELSERGLELQERAPISYTYTGGGHTATISIPTPVIIAGIAWVAGQKTWSYLMSQRGQRAVSAFVTAMANALHVTPATVGEGIVNAASGAAGTLKRRNSEYEITERSSSMDYNDLSAREVNHNH
ncbi:hypothetical protein MMC19_006462 [Ptychographa xylographoides]|nr:hypothetical protein [Ptychographa xylographoides]